MVNIVPIQAQVKAEDGTVFNIAGLKDTISGNAVLGGLAVDPADLSIILPAKDETVAEIVAAMSTANTALAAIEAGQTSIINVLDSIRAAQPSLNGDGGSLSHVTNFPAGFAISGTLPAFAATPTFNFGTLNGAATDNSLQSILAKLNTGLAITNLPSTQVVVPPNAGPGTDFSNGVSLPGGSALKTLTVSNPGAYFVQNLSGDILTAVFDNGTSGGTTFLLASGGLNQAGGVTPALPWFTGRIRVYGPTGSQFAARSN